MRKTASSMRRRVLMLVIAAIGVVALGGTALAGHMAGDVKSYTGCLVPKDGVIIKVKQGNSPASACTGGSTQVHLSGGDITRISVTGALTGGGDNGEVTIGLKPEFTLPDCEQFDFPVKTGSSNWACATHDVGTGLGVDKELGPTSGTVSYRLLPAYRIPGKACATAGQFARGFDNDGNIQCAAPAAATLQVFGSTQNEPAFSQGVGIPDDDVLRTYVSATVPAGSYFLIGKGRLRQDDDDTGFTAPDGIECRLAIGAQLIDKVGFRPKDNQDVEEYGFALTGVVTTTGGDIVLQCRAINDADLVSLAFARFVALKIG